MTTSDFERSSIADYKSLHGVLDGNESVSLVDLGEGVGCFELHSKMNVLNDDIVAYLTRQLAPESDLVRRFDAFVIATDAANFSVGANLKKLHALLAREDWDGARLFIEEFQGMTSAIKFCPRPVVAATAGYCLGGGCEVAMHSAARQTVMELTAGLVEISVGLIPGGGGCKEMLLHALEDARVARAEVGDAAGLVLDRVRTAFTTIARAKRSASALEARSLLLFPVGDPVLSSRQALLYDATRRARELADANLPATEPRVQIAAPGKSVFAALMRRIDEWLAEDEDFSEHDALIAAQLARILSGGGDVADGSPVSEVELLALEREAFVTVCREPKTLERITHMLSTGKPLRN